ncbi:MAG: prenyltransferase [Anaerolineales bacterium]|nr:prenyltransferase [Anaerolineales bacterium]
MARPTQILLIGFVYLFGALLAYASGVSIDSVVLLFGFLALVPTSISIHYANEYADYETDSLTVRTPFSGGSGALPGSGLPRKIALIGAWVALFIGVVLALAGWVLGLLTIHAVAILTVGAFFGWMYSLRPLALAWRGWGELDNALLGGVLLPFYGFVVQSGRLEWWVLVACLPFGAMAFINLLATTWPDREADAIVGKRTLATRWPVGRLRLIYWAVALSAFVLMLLMVGNILPLVVFWGSLLVLPVVVWGAVRYTRQRSPFPTVAAMVLMLGLQMVGWWSVV